MRVALGYEAGAPLVIEEVPVPAIGPRDVLVRIAASGICHTDLTWLSGPAAMTFPIVAGHEGCGTVEAVGPEVRRVKPGERVLASVAPACGTCWWCCNGMSQHCEIGEVVRAKMRYATSRGPMAVALCGCGTFGEAMVVDEASVVSVQTDLPDEELALLGCGVTTGLGAALNTAVVEPGASVAVIGCGGVGQAVIQGARIAGASMIVAIDPVAGRRETSIGVGATHAVDPTVSDSIEEVRALTDGRGADYTFEVVGRPELMTDAFTMARNEGTVVLVGMPPYDASFAVPAIMAVFAGKRVIGSNTGSAQILRDFPRFIRLAESGRLDLGSLISTRIALDEINEGLDLLDRAEGVRTVIV